MERISTPEDGNQCEGVTEMIPTNAVRCQVDNGPMIYPAKPGLSYKCETCGEG